jgi:hypothetical protein
VELQLLHQQQLILVALSWLPCTLAMNCCMETLMVERTSAVIAAFSRLRTAGRLPEKTKITIIVKHLSAHVFIFSIAMALENVQNHFFGLKTGKVIPKLVFGLEKGPISSLPLETQRTHLRKLRGELLSICLNKGFSSSLSWPSF